MTAFCVAPRRAAILPIERPAALRCFSRLSRSGVQNGEDTCLLMLAMLRGVWILRARCQAGAWLFARFCLRDLTRIDRRLRAVEFPCNHDQKTKSRSEGHRNSVLDRGNGQAPLAPRR